MGWAARANPVAQAAKRGDIKPGVKPEREPSVREKSFLRHWDALKARLKATENALIERTPKHLQPAMRELLEK